MRIALIDIEPKVFNTAYMLISAFHKGREDDVQWWSPLMHRSFDVVYCSSLFDFSDKSQVPDDVICGGTGFDVSSRLSRVIERADYDYTIYPKCTTSYLWFSRGCIRRCSWCVVPVKEGNIRPVEIKNMNPRGQYVTVCDNNFFANPLWEKAVKTLEGIGQPVDIQQGVDVRLLDKFKCNALNKMRLYKRKRIRIAWDDPAFDIIPFLQGILRYIPAWKLNCYVLIGFNSSETEDLYRVDVLRRFGIDPFVMVYDKSDPYQRAFARWANVKAIYKKIPWKMYKYRIEQNETAGTGWRR